MAERTDSIVTIPGAFVPFVYINDPETEDLIFGDLLKEGMVVLVEDTTLRCDPDHLATANSYDRVRILETARWCRVENIRYNRTYDNTVVKFVGVYSDGSKVVRSYSQDWAWYVKIASIPE